MGRTDRLLDLDHPSTIRPRTARVLPPRGLSLPSLHGRTAGTRRSTAVTWQPRARSCSYRRDEHEED
jgi:hypothetical protein